MTDFANLNIRGTRRQREIARVLSNAQFDTPLLGPTQPASEEEAWWKSALHFIGKPEEVTVRALGQILTDDPKYNDIFKPSNFDSQSTFVELVGDLGINQDNLGSFGPLIQAVVGIGLAIANPFDPVNKFRVGALTSRGKAGQAIANAGEAALKKGKDGITTISRTGAMKKIARLKKALKKGDLKNTRRNRRSIARLTKGLRDIEESNVTLRALQKGGASIDDLRLAPSLLQRSLAGQQRLLGFSSPTRFDQLALFGARDAPVKLPILPRKLDAALITGGSALIGAIKAPLVSGGRELLKALNFPVMETARSKELFEKTKQILSTSRGDIQEVERQLKSLFKSQKINPELVRDVLDSMQDTVRPELIQVAKGVLNDIILANPKAFELTTGIGVKLAKEGEKRKLNAQRKLLLTPSGLSDNDMIRAIQQFETTRYAPVPIGANRQHDLTVLGDYVVVRGGSGKALAGKLDELEGVYGQKTWRRSKDGRFLVQRRIPHAVRVGTTGTFNKDHLANLEHIAAQLARKKKMLIDVDPSDFLISPFGGVQIINPDIIEDAKSASQAVVNSSQSLDRLAQVLDIPMGPAREFFFLRSPAAARQVAKGVDDFVFRSAGVAEDLIEDTSAVARANAYDLLQEAEGMGPFRTFLRAGAEGMDPRQVAAEIGDIRDFDRANKIEFERAKIRENLLKGRTADIIPIGVTTDEVGRISIRDGQERLAAALMEGLETVPVLKKDHIGDVLDVAKSGYYVGPTRAISDVFQDGGELANSALGSFPGGKMVSGQFRLVTPDGRNRILSGDSLVVPSAGRAFDSVLRFVVQGLSRRASGARATNLVQQLNKVYGNPRSTFIAMSELAEVSNDYVDFANKLQQVTGFDLANVRDIRIADRSNSLFENAVRATATEHLDDLAKSGVLTNLTVSDARRQKLLTSTLGDTLEILDEANNAIKFISSTRKNSDLVNTVEAFFNRAGDAADTEPFAKIILSGTDGEIVREVADFVTKPHPRLSSTVIPNRVFKISQEHREYLKSIGYQIGPTVESLEKVGLNYGQLLGRTINELGIPEFARPIFPYIVTRSGELILSTKSGVTIPRMLDDIFGQGDKFVQEFGHIKAGKVFVSNPLGMMMPQITKLEMRVLENRLKDLAKKFTDMGLSGDIVMEVIPTFDASIWGKMYKKGTTIGDVLDDKFKLKIPELLEGHVPDLIIDTPRFTGEVAFELKEIRIKDSKVAKLVKELRDINDEQFFQLAMRNIPIRYQESYLARNLTPEAKAFFNEAADKWFNKQDKAIRIKNIEPFFKQLVFTDMRVEDINNLIRRLQKAGLDEKTSSSVVADIVKTIRKEAEVDEIQARKLAEIARVLPSGIDLFEIDPIFNTVLRFRAGQQALARADIFRNMADRAAMWSGKIDKLREARAGRDPADKLGREILDFENEFQRVTSEIQTLEKAAPDAPSRALDDLKVRREKLNTKIGQKTAQKSKMLEAFTTRQGAVANDIDFRAENIYLAGEDARKLIDDGLIAADDVVGDTSDLLVRVPVNRVESAIEGAGVEVALFTNDVMPIVDRYLGTMRRDGWNNFLRFYDNILDLWKIWTLFPVPAYHIRNALSSSFMGWLGGVTDFSDYEDSFQVFKILRQHRKGKITREAAMEALDSMPFINTGGQTITAREMYKAFTDLGGLSGGIHYNEFSKMGTLKRASDLDRIMVKNGIPKSSWIATSLATDNVALRLGVSVAAGIENHYRFAAFIDGWRKGVTRTVGNELVTGFEAASLHMKAIHYDYTNLSAFERDVLRRVIPFYSWSRHNIPRMLQTLVTKPTVHYRFAEMVRTMESAAAGGPVSEEDLPEWVKKQFGMIMAKNKDGSYVVKTAEGLLPMADAYKLFSGDAIIDMLKNGLTPFAKVPIEQLTNVDLFRSTDIYDPDKIKKIEDIPGQRAKSFTLGALGFSRRATPEGPLGILNIALNESSFRSFFRLPISEFVGKMLDPLLDSRNYKREKPTIMSQTLALMVGRAYSIDPVKTRLMFQRDFDSKLSRLKSMRKYYKGIGDLRATEDMDNIINHTVLSMGPRSR